MKTKMMEKYLRKIDTYNKVKTPKTIRQKCGKDFLELKIRAKDKEKCFIASVNERITIRKQVREYLKVKEGDVVAVEFNEAKRAGRAEELFKKGKVDLLSLIPEETSKGYEIIISEFEKDSKKFLRIWSPAGTRGARQIEIKRFVNKRALGEILGQYQAEGQKSRKLSQIVFTNKLVEEHRDFVQNLKSMGLSRELISVQCVYNEEICSKEEALSRCKDFEYLVDLEVDNVVSHKARGPLAFRTKVRNVLFAECLFNSLETFRRNLSSNIADRNREVGEGFVAKLLTGDGTFDATISPARDYGSPSINIKVVDEDISALEDYKNVLSNFGFQPFIDEKRIYTRSSCSFENLLFLHEIEAFKNTKNWQQMVVAVMLIMRGRRYRTYKRFIDFSDTEEKISSGFVMENYDVSRKAAQEWLNNKCGEELLEVSRESPYPKLYELTEQGMEIAERLKSISKLAERIKKEKEVKSYEKALETLKGDFKH